MKSRCRHLILLVTALFVALVASALLCACNDSVEDDGTRDLYLSSYRYDSQTDTATALVTLSGEADELTSVKAMRSVSTAPDGVFYNVSTTVYSFDGAALSSACENMTSQDDMICEGKTYSHLKVCVEYATLYKSLRSSATPIKSGRYYLHDIDVEDGAQTVTLVRRTYNSASWYSVLLACSIVLAIALFALVLFAKSKSNTLVTDGEVQSDGERLNDEKNEKE